MKKCCHCKEIKSFSDFHRNKSTADGYNYICKICKKEHAAGSYKKHKEHVSKKNKKWREENKERKAEMDAALGKANREKRNAAFNRWKERHYLLYLERSREYDKKNRSRKTARAAKRRAAFIDRMPSWANPDEIAAFYKAAKLLKMLTGEVWHVDHVVPLQGKLVSGLHVETNLQLLKASDNMSKGNKWQI